MAQLNQEKEIAIIEVNGDSFHIDIEHAGKTENAANDDHEHEQTVLGVPLGVIFVKKHKDDHPDRIQQNAQVSALTLSQAVSFKAAAQQLQNGRHIKHHKRIKKDNQPGAKTVNGEFLSVVPQIVGGQYDQCADVK